MLLDDRSFRIQLAELRAPLRCLALATKSRQTELGHTLGIIATAVFTPFFLGYVPLTFTSAFPAGGVYYPYVLRHFRGLPSLSGDVWLLEHAPQPLDFLTQDIGPLLAITGFGSVGPIAVTVAGLIVAAIVYLLFTAWHLIGKHCLQRL